LYEQLNDFRHVTKVRCSEVAHGGSRGKDKKLSIFTYGCIKLTRLEKFIIIGIKAASEVR